MRSFIPSLNLVEFASKKLRTRFARKFCFSWKLVEIANFNGFLSLFPDTPHHSTQLTIKQHKCIQNAFGLMIRKFNAIKAFKLFRLFSSRVFDGMKIDSCSIALFTSNSTNQTRWWRLLRLNNMDFVVERKISGCNESALYFYAYKHKNKLPISPSLWLESEVFSRFFFVQSSDDFFYSL